MTVNAKISTRPSRMATGLEAAPPARLPPIADRSLADQVAQILVQGIAAGRIARGDRLIETRLARDFGISRIPLREALRELEIQGIVSAEPRRGRRVADFDDLQVHHVCEARLALERLAVRAAAETYKREPHRLAALDRLLKDMRDNIGPKADRLKINQADIDFHSEIYAASGNACLQTLWDMLSRQVVIVFALETFNRLDPRRNYEQHVKLRDLLARADAKALDREIEGHIMSYMKEDRRKVAATGSRKR
jgi:DNA-binding GntR family transcriptional regulator